LLHAQVAVRAQALGHLGRVEAIAFGEVERARHDEIRRWQTTLQRARLDDDGFRLAAREPIKAEQPIGEQVQRRRDRLVGKGFVVREATQVAPAEKRHFPLELVGFGRRCGNHAHGPRMPGGRLGRG
jgi:hypothetical protein